VNKGDVLAGMRVIPLIIEEEKIKDVESLVGRKPLFEMMPYKIKKAALVVTGTEVATGLIEGKFSPVLYRKLAAFGVEFISREVASDSQEEIVKAIKRARNSGAEIIFLTGGMS